MFGNDKEKNPIISDSRRSLVGTAEGFRSSDIERIASKLSELFDNSRLHLPVQCLEILIGSSGNLDRERQCTLLQPREIKDVASLQLFERSLEGSVDTRVG